MNLRLTLDFLRRRGWLLALVCVVAAGGAYYVSRQLTPIYRASATVLVNQTQTQGVIGYNDVLTSERLTSTYAELAKRRAILTDVKSRLALIVDEDDLADMITVSPVTKTQLLRIAVENADPALAVSIANATAETFIDENTKQLVSRPGTVSIAERAFLPKTPIKPNVALNTALAAILGLMVGIGIGVLLEYLDDTVKSSEDVEELAGLTTLGSVTRFKNRKYKGAGSAAEGIEQEFVEDYRQMRTNIHFSMLGPGPKSILVTSSYPQEGKSTTCANLAIVLAQAGHRVILVDTDLRRPSLHRYFGTANSFGLTGLLLSQAESAEAALVPTGVPGLRLLPSGPLPPNPSEILMSEQVLQIMESVKALADYVILDSPPLMAVTDARLIAGHSDATVLVVERGRTRSETFQRSCEALAQANARVIGVVINKLKSTHKPYYSYGYYRRNETPQMPDIAGSTDAKVRDSGRAA